MITASLWAIAVALGGIWIVLSDIKDTLKKQGGKEMKAPDKKYPLSIVNDLLASMPPNKIVFMPDKIYFDGVDTSTTPRLAINEEYIRKDKIREMVMYARNISQTPDAAIRNFDGLIKKINEL